MSSRKVECNTDALRLQAEAHFKQGNQLVAAGKFKTAAREYESALKLFPGRLSVMRNLVKAEAMSGDGIAAVSLISEMFSAGHTNQDKFTDLIELILSTCGTPSTQEHLAKLAVDHEIPTVAQRLLMFLLESDDAVSTVALEQIKKANFKDSLVDHLLGYVQIKCGFDSRQVLSSFRRASEKDPLCEQFLEEYAIQLCGLGDYAEALLVYRRLVGVNSGSASGWFGIAACLAELGRVSPAIDAVQRCLNIDPNDSDAHILAGSLRATNRDLLGAVKSYREALRLAHDEPDLLGNLFHTEMSLGMVCKAHERTLQIQTAIEGGLQPCNPFVSITLFDDPFLTKRLVNLVNSTAPSRDCATPRTVRSESENRAIRVGFFSNDFCEHPVGRLTLDLFSIEWPGIEVILFQLGNCPDDRVHQSLRSLNFQYTSLSNYSEDQAVQFIRAAELDVAVDMAGFTKGNRIALFRSRVAPVQVNFLGYPGTLGHGVHDYIVVDPQIAKKVPNASIDEAFALMPLHLLPPGPKFLLDQHQIGARSDYGLPETGIVLGALHSPHKITKGFLESLGIILSRSPAAVVWLSDHGPEFRKNISSFLSERNVDSSQLVWAPRVSSYRDHLIRQVHQDLFLDTFPYGAHSTGMDALKLGVPVLTRQGESIQSNVMASLLDCIGMPGLITQSQLEFEATAIDLIHSGEKLDMLRSLIVQQVSSSPAFRTKTYADGLNQLITEMARRSRKHLEPCTLQLRPNS